MTLGCLASQGRESHCVAQYMLTVLGTAAHGDKEPAGVLRGRVTCELGLAVLHTLNFLTCSKKTGLGQGQDTHLLLGSGSDRGEEGAGEAIGSGGDCGSWVPVRSSREHLPLTSIAAAMQECEPSVI